MATGMFKTWLIMKILVERSPHPAYNHPLPAKRGEGRGEGIDSSRNEQLGALEIKPEADFLESGLAHGMTQPGLVLRIKHEETATSRANELAAEGAAGHRQVIPLVDFRIAHAAAALLFALPVHVHQSRKLAQVAGFQRALTLQAQVLDEVQ